MSKFTTKVTRLFGQRNAGKCDDANVFLSYERNTFSGLGEGRRRRIWMKRSRFLGMITAGTNSGNTRVAGKSNGPNWRQAGEAT